MHIPNEPGASIRQISITSCDQTVAGILDNQRWYYNLQGHQMVKDSGSNVYDVSIQLRAPTIVQHSI